MNFRQRHPARDRVCIHWSCAAADTPFGMESHEKHVRAVDDRTPHVERRPQVSDRHAPFYRFCLRVWYSQWTGLRGCEMPVEKKVAVGIADIFRSSVGQDE